MAGTSDSRLSSSGLDDRGKSTPHHGNIGPQATGEIFGTEGREASRHPLRRSSRVTGPTSLAEMRRRSRSLLASHGPDGMG